MKENRISKNIIFSPPKVSTIAIFISQFKSPLIYILLFAVVLTLLLKEYTDALVIGLAVMINAILGFVQEYKAQNTLVHLKQLLTPKAHIFKNGKIEIIDSEDVMLDDIVLLTREYSIPADGIVIESEGLEINEAVLTGETLPIIKKVNDRIYTGTIIKNGIGKMRITQIGVKTKIGIIGKNVLESKEQETPLQQQISNLAKFLSKVVVSMVIIIFILGLLQKHELEEMIITSVAVAVAAIPEGLVITLTVILTIGMKRILDRKAVVRKLISAETLGSVSVICTDKTGTITLGQLKVVESDFKDREIGELSAILCNNRIDSLETSLYEWVMNSEDPFTKNIILKAKGMPRLDGLSFSDKTKFTATLNHFNDQSIILIFGAPEKVLELCQIDSILKKEWENKIISHGQMGRKIVGFAYKIVPNQKLELEMIHSMKWNGIVIYEDPIRQSIHKTIQQCQKAGIRIKMITGDFLPTAKYVGQKIGLIPLENGENYDKYILTGEELRALKGQELRDAVNNATVFTRIDPLEKHLIVNILKEMGEVVAMTGDGVNDAPALKASDIGVVVNEASDISKNTADIVLLDSNLRTIEHAVREGRIIFDNIRKIVLFLLSGGFTEITLIIGALALGLPLPVTAAQLLWVNLIEDSLPSLALAFEKQSKGIMDRPPRKKDTPIIDKRMKIILLTYIIVSDSILMGLFFYLFNKIGDIDLVRTIIFLGIGIDSLLSIYAFKSLRNSIFTYNPFSNLFLNFSVIFGFAMFFIAIYVPWFNVLLGTVPLPLDYFLLMSGFGFLNIALIEFVKFATLKYWKER